MKTVADLSPEMAAMDEQWRLIEALSEGTIGMRKQRTRYLPQRPLETQIEYDDRLKMATLYPAFSVTVDNMVGRVFAEPMVLGEDIPSWMPEEVLNDVDLQGHNLHVYCRNWFKEALEYGVSFTLIDSPVSEGVQTKAEQKALGIRPYAIQINPRRILGGIVENGKLVQVRIHFTRQEVVDTYFTREVEQIRVYVPGSVTIFEKSASSKTDWAEIEKRTITKEIPLIAFYTKQTGSLTGKPPLLELAHLNTKHWWLQSSNDSIVDIVQVPIFARSGITSNEPAQVGTKHGLNLPQGGDAKFVEHSGRAIGTGFTALDRIKDEMIQAGGRLLLPQTGNKTATQASEDASRENSTLGAMVQSFEDTVDAMLDMIAMWRGETSGGSVEIKANLDPDQNPIEIMTFLEKMADSARLSDQSFFKTGQDLGVIPDHLVWEEEQVRIQESVPMPIKTATPVPNDGIIVNPTDSPTKASAE